MSSPFHQAIAKAMGGFAKVEQIPASIATRKLDYASRRSLASGALPKVVTLQLVEGAEFCDWEEIQPIIPGMKQAKRQRSGGGRSQRAEGETVLQFERLAPSEITLLLQKVDRKLTPKMGLRRWNHDRMKLESAVATGRPMLLIVHGTFSNSDSFFKSFLKSEHGRRMLESLLRIYRGELYALDHPTLSVSPWINALDLERALGNRHQKVDFLAHSRGGLVVRWWNQLFDPDGTRCRKSILVGSPLAGTSLAAPPNLRNVIRQLTSYGNGLAQGMRVASLAVPCLSVVHVLLRVLTSMGTLGANVPIVDAALGLVPGLFGQSRVGNNQELLRLHQTILPLDERFYAIRSNFESEQAGWRFWRAFRKEALIDSATDWIFQGANDLVVDVDSMDYLTGDQRISPSRILDFGTNDQVHHINYFDFERTSDFIASVLDSKQQR